MSDRSTEGTPNLLRKPNFKSGTILCAILLTSLVLQSFLPLKNAIRIGADEDFELSKATLCAHGYHLYSEIWDDEPPLDTFLITQLVKHVSGSVLGPRLLTVAWALVLLCSTFVLVRNVSGLAVAALATCLLIVSPAFLELSSSCMQEMPALAAAVASLCVLQTGPRTKLCGYEILAGLIFAVSLQLKLIGMIYLPLAVLILALRHKTMHLPLRSRWKPLLLFVVSMLLGFVVVNAATGSPLILQFQQAWSSHFGGAKSFEYGNAEEHRFQWVVLLRNWDTTAPAILGAVFLLRGVRGLHIKALPIAWLVLTLIVFPLHKPWWTYYYVHNSVPLCWCAGVGLVGFWQYALAGSRWRQRTIAAVFCVCATAWMGARVYLQELSIRNSPRLNTCLVLDEIKRFKPFTQFLFCDQPIFSFHADIPMPPRLAVNSLKRFWSGDMTIAGIVRELEEVKPGLILLSTENRDPPYLELLNREYKLVYEDSANRLYAHRSISKKPGF